MSLLLSLLITIAIVSLYVFYPLLSLLFRQLEYGGDSSGVFAVGGGVPSLAFAIVEPVVFVILFALLSRKRTT